MSSAESAPVTKMIENFVLTQSTGGVGSAYAGEATVDQGQIGTEGLCGFEGRRAVADRTDLVPVALQDGHEEVSRRPFVLQDQHLHLGHEHPFETLR